MTSRCLSAWSIVEWCGLTNALLSFNPNLNPANGAAASNPFRLDRSQAVTSDQDHNYTAEQQAFDAGLMDLFPSDTPRRRSHRPQCLRNSG
jgi:phospholipase C